MATVVFVDDQIDFLHLLEARLRGEEYKKYFCVSGDEAWHLICTEKVDVLVSDLNMPSMSGLELLKKCKKAYPRIVRVALTSMNSSGVILESFNGEVVHRFLPKPWRADDDGKQTIREFIELSLNMADGSVSA